MLSLILGFITGLAGPVSSIAGKIIDLKNKKVDAQSEYEKKQIDQQIAEAEDRKAVLVAEAGNRVAGGINASVRFLLALGPLLFLSKVFVWDKVVGSFVGCSDKVLSKTLDCHAYNTDPLDTNLWAVIVAVLGFYFMYDIFSKSRK